MLKLNSLVEWSPVWIFAVHYFVLTPVTLQRWTPTPVTLQLIKLCMYRPCLLQVKSDSFKNFGEKHEAYAENSSCNRGEREKENVVCV